MAALYKNQNCYTDISGLVLGEFTEAFEDYMSEEIKDAIIYAGDPGRFLFGTDWPICSMSSYVNFVKQLGLPPDSYARIMGENAQELFKLPTPPAVAARGATIG